MNEIPDTNAVLDGIIVSRGPLGAAKGPREAELLLRIEAAAERRGQSLERLELVHARGRHEQRQQAAQRVHREADLAPLGALRAAVARAVAALGGCF